MPFDFPSSPAIGDIYTVGDANWRWTGTAWTRRMEQAQRTRTQLATWLANGGVPIVGQSYWADNLQFIGAPLVTATISDLPGMVPPPDRVTPQHFTPNAVPGTTDMTSAIQAALNWASLSTPDGIAGGEVHVPSGTYLVTATITVPARVRMFGAGWLSSVIYRTGAYGDTFAMSGGWLTMDDMSFVHSVMPANQAVAAPIANRLTDDSAHFRLTNSGKCYFNRCFFSRMPYHIVWTGASLLHLDGCEFTGVWHPSDTTMQETKRSILLNDGTEDKSQLFKARACRWVGAVGPSASVSITDGSANASTITMDKEQAWGPEYQVEIQCCEMAVFDACYLNRASSGLVLYAANLPEASAGPNYGHSWTNCEFDSGMGQANTDFSNHITFSQREPGCVTRLITFTSCKFYGGKNVKHAIYCPTTELTNPDTGVTTTNSPTVFGLTASNCTFMNLTGNALRLEGAKTVLVTGCTFSAWNSLGLPNVDKKYTAAIWRGQYASKVHIVGCAFGGGGNTFIDPGVVFGASSPDVGEQINHAYQGIFDNYPTDGEMTVEACRDIGCREYLWSRLNVPGAYFPAAAGPATGAYQGGYVPCLALTLTVADDAVGTFTLPTGRTCGFATVNIGIMATNPGDTRQAMIYFNAGSSLSIQKNTGFTVGGIVDVSTSNVTGTTGTDGRVTVAVQAGVLKVENRIGSSQNITVHVF
jgi:hypothetical protein